MDYIIEEIDKEHGINLKNDSMAMQRIKESAEKAKKDLSGMTSTQISLPFIAQKDGEPVNFEMDITRAKFEQLVDDLIESTLTMILIKYY